MLPWFVRGYIMEHFRQLPLPPSDCPKVQLPLLCCCGIVAPKVSHLAAQLLACHLAQRLLHQICIAF